MLNRTISWIKVLRELQIYKSRTIIVILAIAVSVSGMGMVNTSQVILLANYREQYLNSHPSHAQIMTSVFGERLLRAIHQLPEVEAADARYIINGQTQLPAGEAHPIVLRAVAEIDSLSVDKVTPLEGAQLPLPKGGVLLERSVLVNHSLRIGDPIQVRMPDGKYHDLVLSGFVHAATGTPTSINGGVNAFISFETAFWLENDEKGTFAPGSQKYNQIVVITTEHSFQKADIDNAVSIFRRDLARLDPNLQIGSLSIPVAGKPALQDTLNTIWIILQIAGATSLLLSMFLISNIMVALISGQIRQIGVMKALGAYTGRILEIYLFMAFVLSSLALFLAIPLGALTAAGTTAFLARILNADVNYFYVPAGVIAAQIVLALFASTAATILPALSVTRVTTREALSASGQSGATSAMFSSRAIAQFSLLPISITLPIRNLFRQRIRMLLTLTALSIGGTAFIGVMGTRNALDRAFDEATAETNYNIQIAYQLTPEILTAAVERETRAIPGVNAVETWKTGYMYRIFSDGTKSGSVDVIAVSPATGLLHMAPVQGDWLNNDHRNQIYINRDALEVIGADVLEQPPVMELNGARQTWQVVGLASRSLIPTVYIREADYDRLYNNQSSARLLVIQTSQSDETFVEQVKGRILALFKARKWRITTSSTVNVVVAKAQVNNVIYVLLGTALLIAIVGGLGLANALQLNIIEHTREIGVLRSMGAESSVIRRMVIIESLTICMISLIIAAPLSNLFGTTMSDLVGQALLARPMTYAFATSGFLIWIGIMIVIGLLATLSPAQYAINLTIRDTLAYE